ncbi:hypothetical protein CLV30_106101 [Haloactinopolyspora alba]|uniref:Uncharacterized protein n=1 Tax=Haloactinopolyspora alba TaxID=648780 RepID=A0A2P8E3P7_9ACTN|nr:hypothetical protein [Haloactinopolyspora alba]PSL04098.1 hypothetical protein CLV30_106101 [Haloactinopolyspora alba]
MKVRLTARKDEIQAITDVLEDDTYESAEKLARAVVTTTMRLLLDRDWYVVASRNGGNNLLYGPVPSENEAFKAINSGELGLGGEVGVFPVRSVSNRERAVEELDADPNPACAACNHPKVTHEHPEVNGCVVKTCKCKKYTT